MLLQKEVDKIGYISRSIDETLDIKKAILDLKKEKDAIILAHYYTRAELQVLADVVGDSLALSQAARQANSSIILFIGVYFMAETAKILNPSSKVLLPDLNAGCSLADDTPTEAFVAFKAKHPEAVVVSYINCSAEIKAHSDIICTSSNAVDIVNRIPRDKPIIFAPDRNLGKYVERETARQLILWDGACVVHENLSLEKLNILREKYPEAEVLAHPECVPQLLAHADFIGSTKKLIDRAKTTPATTLIVGTEVGILWEMQRAAPTKKIIPIPAQENNHCACSTCPYMKMNTLEKVYNALYYELPEVTVPEPIRIQAHKAIQAMLSMN